jgi:hypothetical protein
MKPKPILKSKTFWLNILGAAAAYSGYFPPEIAIPIMAVANIVNRFFTSQPVNITGESNDFDSTKP